MSKLVITIEDGKATFAIDGKTVSQTQVSAVQALLGGEQTSGGTGTGTVAKPTYTHTAQPSYPPGDQDAWVVPIGRKGVFEWPLSIPAGKQTHPATINVAAASGAEPVAAIALVNSGGTVVLNQDAGAAGARLVFNVGQEGEGLPNIAPGSYTLRINVTNDVPDARIQIKAHNAGG